MQFSNRLSGTCNMTIYSTSLLRIPCKWFSLGTCSKTKTYPILVSMDHVKIDDVIEGGILRRIFNDNRIIAFYQRSDLSPKQWDDLRVELRKIDVNLKVLKNRIAKNLIVGTKFETLKPLFEGQPVIAFAKNDTIQELLTAISKNSNLLLLAGLMDNKLLSHKQLEELAKLPNKDFLIGTFMYQLSQPGSRFLSLLQQKPNTLLQYLRQIEQRKLVS